MKRDRVCGNERYSWHIAGGGGGRGDGWRNGGGDSPAGCCGDFAAVFFPLKLVGVMVAAALVGLMIARPFALPPIR